MLSSQSLNATTSAKVGVIALYFLPTILLVLCYVLLYHQLEMLMVKSRIASSDNYRTFGNLNSEKLASCMRYSYYSLIGVFVFLQVILLLLSLFDVINLNAFFGEITGFTVTLILGVNFYLIFIYCKNTGTPYKSRKSY